MVCYMVTLLVFFVKGKCQLTPKRNQRQAVRLWIIRSSAII